MPSKAKEQFLKYLQDKGTLSKDLEEEMDEMSFLPDFDEDQMDLDSLMSDLGDDLSFHDNPKDNIGSNDAFAAALRRTKGY